MAEKSLKDRTISADDINAISLEVKHIEQLASLAINKLEHNMDEESDTLLTLIGNQANKVQDMLAAMFQGKTKEG